MSDDNVQMDELDTRLLKLTQDGIPLTHSPFADVAKELGMTEEDVVDRIKHLQMNGFIRRFGASIGHRAIGITANAMCTWNVPDELVEEVGAVMAGFSEVTHCYERPRYPDWPYNLFTMVHSYTRDDCERVAKEISLATGISDYNLLYSVREFKKTGVRL
jgi:DNA-binding Lrp family transcriptional regulator